MNFYYLMFSVKKVELQINPRTDNIQQVIKMISKQKIIEKAFIILTGANVIITFILLTVAVDLKKVKIIFIFWMILSIFNFAINIYIIQYFIKMANYLMKTLSVSIKINIVKTKIMITAMTIMLITSLILDYIFFQVIVFVNELLDIEFDFLAQDWL